MTQTSRRLERLFCCLISGIALLALPARGAEPNKTIIADTLYRADGTPARGTLLISWPAFSSADGKPVAAGTLTVKIAPTGSVNIPLLPTQGATPAGTAYKVVASLDDGSTSTEYWAVPTLSPTTIAAIRSTQVPTTVAMQVVSREYVDGQLATAVRKNGDETISGSKTFVASPLVPSPGTEAAAANKGYVDVAIAAAATSGSSVLNISKGGTGTNAFAAARCVRVAGDGNSLESAAGDCGADSDTVDGHHAADLQSAVSVSARDFVSGGDGSWNNAWTSVSGTGGIQEAINNAPAGGTVQLPKGVYEITAGITITKPITLIGSGWGTGPFNGNVTSGTILRYRGGVFPTGADVIRVVPAAGAANQITGFRLQDFEIYPTAESGGRYAIYLDGTNNQIWHGIIDHIFVSWYGSGPAIYADGSGAAQGTPLITTLQNSYVWATNGGIGLANGGDTIRILNNQISGGGKAIDAAFQPGATTMILRGNNVTSNGGIHLGASTNVAHIVDNEFETFATFTGSHGAFLDVDGAAGATALNTLIQGNSFQMVNGAVADAVRLNYATATRLVFNRFVRGAGASHDITIMGSASDTRIESNTFETGLPFTAMVNDLGGANTSFLSPVAGDGAALVSKNNQALQWFDNLGNPYNVYSSQNGGPLINGYRGRQFAMVATNGHTYLYDGVDHGGNSAYIALDLSTDSTNYSQAGTVANVQTLNAKTAVITPKLTASDDQANPQDYISYTGEGTTLKGYRGNNALWTANGHVYIYEGSSQNKIGLEVSTDATNYTQAGTYVNGQTLNAKVAVNTPKLTGITDTAVVTNLNADRIDGKHATDFVSAGTATWPSAGTVPTSADVPAAGSCANQVVTALNNGAAPTCGAVTNAMLAPAAYRVPIRGYCTGVAGTGQVISVMGLGATAITCAQTTAPGVAGGLMTSAGTIKNLYVNEGTGQKNGTTMTWTAYKNNVATALTCTVANGQTACNDVTHSFTVAAGDYVTLKSGTTASSSETLANVSVAMEVWN